MIDPVGFFDAVQGHSPDNKRDISLATVDPAYTGSGPARVTFDGETVLTLKSYHFIGMPPLAGKRVMMTPVSNTYVISGMLNGGA